MHACAHVREGFAHFRAARGSWLITTQQSLPALTHTHTHGHTICIHTYTHMPWWLKCTSVTGQRLGNIGQSESIHLVHLSKAKPYVMSQRVTMEVIIIILCNRDVICKIEQHKQTHDSSHILLLHHHHSHQSVSQLVVSDSLFWSQVSFVFWSAGVYSSYRFQALLPSPVQRTETQTTATQFIACHIAAITSLFVNVIKIFLHLPTNSFFFLFLGTRPDIAALMNILLYKIVIRKSDLTVQVWLHCSTLIITILRGKLGHLQFFITWPCYSGHICSKCVMH